MIAEQTADPTYIVADQERMALATNYYEWQAQLVRPQIGPRVIEAGCGIGNFTRTLLDRETLVAVDIADYALDMIRKRYPGQRNLELVQCDVSGPEFLELSRFGADSCVCMNVLEHIGNDRAALAGMGAVVRRGGSVVLLVPAFDALYGPIDRMVGHYRRYSRRAIGELAAQAGLRIRRSCYLNLAGFFGWWANSHVFRRDAQSEAQIRFFDNWIVPVESRLEAIIKPPFGQSLFVVLEKP